MRWMALLGWPLFSSPFPQMTWRPQYRSSKFRHVFGKAATKENCFDGVPITRSVQDNSFCAINPRFLAVITECAGGGAFLVLSVHHVSICTSHQVHRHEPRHEQYVSIYLIMQRRHKNKVPFFSPLVLFQSDKRPKLSTSDSSKLGMTQILCVCFISKWQLLSQWNNISANLRIFFGWVTDEVHILNKKRWAKSCDIMEEILGVQVVGLQKCCLLSHFSEDKVKKFTLM